MIKVFTVNGNGKIEFTKAELEKLLNEAYTEGQKNCNCGNTITWTNPYVTPYLNYSDSNTSANGAPTPATITLNNTNAKEISQRIDEIIKNAAAKIDNDAFSNLARELNF